MIAVACFAARAASVPAASMTSTLSRTNSAAISAKRSGRPSAQRYSIMMLVPSLQPSCRSRCVKATAHWFWVAGVAPPSQPIVGTRACCARAASGHAAAPASNVTNSRRFTGNASRASDRKDSTPRALRWPMLTCFLPLFGDAIAMTEAEEDWVKGALAMSKVAMRKVAVYIAFVISTAWLLFGSLQLPQTGNHASHEATIDYRQDTPVATITSECKHLSTTP